MLNFSPIPYIASWCSTVEDVMEEAGVSKLASSMSTLIYLPAPLELIWQPRNGWHLGMAQVGFIAERPSSS